MNGRKQFEEQKAFQFAGHRFSSVRACVCVCACVRACVHAHVCMCVSFFFCCWEPSELRCSLRFAVPFSGKVFTRPFCLMCSKMHDSGVVEGGISWGAVGHETSHEASSSQAEHSSAKQQVTCSRPSPLYSASLRTALACPLKGGTCGSAVGSEPYARGAVDCMWQSCAMTIF